MSAGALFDVVPVGPVDVRLVQSKAGGEYFSAMERERITGLTVPSIPGWAPTAQLSNSALTER